MRPAPVRPVVVGVDASDSARDAAEWAADLAAAWNAPLHLVQVVHGWPDEGPVPELASWLRELVEAAERTGVGTVEAEVVPGGVVDTLVARATGAGMLVIGSYGDAPLNNVRQPGNMNVDLSMSKTFPLGARGHRLQIRADAYNAFRVTTRTVNVAAQYDPLGNQVNSDFGRLALPTDEARQIELSLRFSF